MLHGATPSLDGRLYRAALSLCPAGFRREHADEMARDFDEARSEAAAVGDHAVWHLRFAIGVDLLRTVMVQWVRTGLPAIAFASLVAAVALAAGVVTLISATTVRIPDDLPDAEILGVLLLAVICVVLIAMTMAVNVWVSGLNRRRRR
jgi:hypothetical protein